MIDPRRATTGFVIPAPVSGFSDRTLLDGVSTARSRLRVQTLRLMTGGTQLSFSDVVEWNETNLDRALDFTTGFASMDYPGGP